MVVVRCSSEFSMVLWLAANYTGGRSVCSLFEHCVAVSCGLSIVIMLWLAALWTNCLVFRVSSSFVCGIDID